MKSKWRGILILFGLVFLLDACAVPSAPTPLLTETVAPSATWTLTPLPTDTPTPLPSATPTNTRTSTPRPTATRRLTPMATLTPSPTAGPSPTPSAAQTCDALTKRSSGIYVVYIHPVPDLVWDTIPRQFQVGLCDAIPLPSTPQGKYKIVLNFPGSAHGSTESAPVAATLKPGLNEVSVGPWIPGFQNHMAACATRAVAQTQVMYNDTPDRFFHALLWADGSDHVALPIKCGGNYS